jgi:hypothetical protein
VSAQLDAPRSSADIYDLRPTPPKKRSHSQIEDRDSGFGNDSYENALPPADESMDLVNGDGYEYETEYPQIPIDPQLDTSAGAPSSPILRKNGRSQVNGVNHSIINGEHDIDYDEDIQEEEPRAPAPVKRGRGRPRKSDTTVIEEPTELSTVGSAKSVKNKPGRPRKGMAPAVKNASKPAQSSKTQSRAKKSDKYVMPPPELPSRREDAQPDSEEDTDNSMPSFSVEPEEEVSRPTKKSKMVASTALADRDPNVMGQPSKSSLWSKPNKKPGSRSLQIMNDNRDWRESSIVTKSGRRSIAPVAWWRGEGVKCEWTGEVREIYRIPEVVEGPKRKRKKTRNTTRSVSAMPTVMEDEIELEEWETKGEVLTGPVSVWDNEQGIADEDEQYEMGKSDFLATTFSLYEHD